MFLAVLVLAASASASAQPSRPTPGQVARARRDFEQARIDFDAGRFESALAGFGRAYQVTASPELLYNIGVCHDRLRRDAQALASFEEYLERVPDAPDRTAVQRRIVELRRAQAAEVPAAEQTAQGAELTVGPSGPDDGGLRDDGGAEGGSILARWWFWTAAGVVVAGVVVGILLASSGSPPPLVTGDDGGVIRTLRAP